jgi:hypothetical protein
LPINFTINPTGGTATAGSDYTNFTNATISVLPGSSTGTYSVLVTDDALFENDETITSTITSPSDPAVTIGTASATEDLIDDDNTNVDASISIMNHGAEAGQVAIDYTVTLAKVNNTGADITIDANPTGGTATASLDYTTFVGTLVTIPVGMSSASFSVPVRDDTLFENDETVTATLSMLVTQLLYLAQQVFQQTLSITTTLRQASQLTY